MLSGLAQPGQSLWRHELKKGDAPVPVDLDLHGRKTLVLITADIGNTASLAFGDWADAKFAVEGDAPKSVGAPSLGETAVILTGIIAVVICLAATIFPSLYAANLRPADGFREQ